MKISRRNFIKSGTLLTVFSGSALFAPVPASGQTDVSEFDESLSLTEASRDIFFGRSVNDFEPYIGAEFIFLTAEGAITAVLSEVRDSSKDFKPLVRRMRTDSSSKATVRNFVLTFQMPSDQFFQANYQIWHPKFGQFELFLVPDKCVADKVVLHAVINRL